MKDSIYKHYAPIAPFSYLLLKQLGIEPIKEMQEKMDSVFSGFEVNLDNGLDVIGLAKTDDNRSKLLKTIKATCYHVCQCGNKVSMNSNECGQCREYINY